MRIAFDHQIFGWQTYGGISRYAFELARTLAATEDVRVVSPLYVTRYLAQAPDTLKVWGMAIPQIARTGRIVRAVNAPVARAMLWGFKPDIVHETYYAARSVAPKRARRVLTVYDMIHERFPESFRSADPTSREKRAAVARADHVICISHQTRQDLIEIFDVDPEKVSVVHLGFTLTSGDAFPAEATEGRPFVLYVGNRGGYKNFDGLLRAVASLPRLRDTVDIVCFGGGGFSGQEIRRIAELGLDAARVRQVSGSDAVLAGLYRAARLFVFPSRYEGFGIPPLEAMSFGCPVACANVSSIPEVVGDAGAYFDPDDPGDIAATIDSLLADDDGRRQLIARGHTRLEQFSWARCADETAAVYRTVLGRG